MAAIEDKPPHTIGAVAAMLGVTHRTLRFYEELHLVTPKRKSSARRRYSDAEVAHLQKITQLAYLGFSLVEVKQLLNYKSEDQVVKALYQRRDEVSAEIEHLQQVLGKITDEIAAARVPSFDDAT